MQASQQLPAHVEVILGHLAQQDPVLEDMQHGCYVASFSHRAREGRGRIFMAPGGSWTHDESRATQLAERYPA